MRRSRRRLPADRALSAMILGALVVLAAAAGPVTASAAPAGASPADVCTTNIAARLLTDPGVRPAQPVASPPDAFVVLYSGDGGWAEADCGFSQRFAERGLPVVGVNSVRYFASAKTPAEAAAHLSQLIEANARQLGRPKVILMGYSFGASALPIIIGRLPPASRARIAGVVLAGPGDAAELVLRPRSWMNQTSASAIPVEPALQRMTDLKVVCVYGAEDKQTACPRFKPGLVQTKVVSSSHRFAGAYGAVVDTVLAALK